MGYDDLKVVEAREFLRSIAGEAGGGADLDDAVRSAQVLEAMAESAAGGRWVAVPAG
jgi:predicted dehydrogenase